MSDTQNVQSSSEQVQNFDAELLKEEIQEEEREFPNTDFDTEYELAKQNSTNPVSNQNIEPSKNPQTANNTTSNTHENLDVNPVAVSQEFLDMAKSIQSSQS